jgi:hypothetical protein
VVRAGRTVEVLVLVRRERAVLETEAAAQPSPIGSSRLAR